MKKLYLLYFLIMIFIIVSLILFTKKTDEKDTVVFWTLQLGTFDKYINNVINEFEVQNPDIKIKWIDVPYSEGEKRTLAALLTDNPPDLVNLTPDFSLMLAQKNALFFIDEQFLDSYIPSLSDALAYKGKYFGIPFYATSAVTLYNSELTKKMHLTQMPVTYDDLFNIPFEKKDSFYLTMISFSENDTLLKLLNKYSINSPETINSNKSILLFEKFKQMYDRGSFPKESVTLTHRDALEKYMSGQLAFLVTGANFINMINENAPDIYKNTGVLPQLTGDTKAYDYSLMNFIIPKKAKHKQEALKFALFLTNKENQLEFAKLTSILPVNKFALQDEYFIQNSNSDIKVQARKISAQQLYNLQTPLNNIKNKKDLNTLSANCIQSILINNKNIQETLDNFALYWQKL